jgi:hypothetical protein
MLSQILTAIIALASFQLRRGTNRDKRASTSSGSETKASKSPINLPDADVLAQEIVEDLEAALEQFREIALDLAADEPTEKDQRINR